MEIQTFLTLLISGILGIIAHAFKISDDKNKAQEPKYTIKNYWAENKNGIMMAFICIAVISYFTHDIKKIKELEAYISGPCYFALGFTADSSFPALLGLFTKVIDKIKNIGGSTAPPPQQN